MTSAVLLTSVWWCGAQSRAWLCRTADVQEKAWRCASVGWPMWSWSQPLLCLGWVLVHPATFSKCSTHWGCEALSQQFTRQPVMDDSHDFRPSGALLYPTKIPIVPLLTYPASMWETKGNTAQLRPPSTVLAMARLRSHIKQAGPGLLCWRTKLSFLFTFVQLWEQCKPFHRTGLLCQEFYIFDKYLYSVSQVLE